jgi:transglutaminase-like putative cysteine protease
LRSNQVRTILVIAIMVLLGADALAEPIAPIGLVSRERGRSYVLELSILGSREPTVSSGARPAFDIPGATVSLPILARSASHITRAANASAEQRFNEFVLYPGNSEVLEDTAPDGYRVEFEYLFGALREQGLTARGGRAESLRVQARASLDAFDTVYNETAAREIAWPTKLPSDFGPYSAPDNYIVSNHPAVLSLLDRWSSGTPRAIPPAALAKRLAAEMIRAYRPDETFLANWPAQDRSRGRLQSPCDPRSFPPDTGARALSSVPAFPTAVNDRSSLTFRGFDITDVRLTARDACFVPRILEPIETGRANDAVLCNLYAALLRAAGIPARIVFGATIDESQLIEQPFVFSLGDPFFGVGNRRYNQIGPFYFVSPRPRVWVEFFLFDDSTGKGDWIPVDLTRQMRESSAPPPLDRPWRFFGNHDELHLTIPVSSVYAVSGGESPDWVPALWSWQTDPTLPFFIDATIQVRIEAPRVTSRSWGVVPGGVAPPSRP